MNTKTIITLLASCAGLLIAGCASTKLEGSLNGTSWTVQSLNKQAVLPSSPLTLSFTAEGKISGSTGCNSYLADYTYTASARTIAVASINRTFKSCVPSEVMTQERKFLQALQAAASYKVDSESMTLCAADGTETITFVEDCGKHCLGCL